MTETYDPRYGIGPTDQTFNVRVECSVCGVLESMWEWDEEGCVFFVTVHLRLGHRITVQRL